MPSQYIQHHKFLLGGNLHEIVVWKFGYADYAVSYYINDDRTSWVSGLAWYEADKRIERDFDYYYSRGAITPGG